MKNLNNEKPKTVNGGDYTRIVQVPVVVSENLLQVVRYTDGVVLHTVKQAGKSEVYYEIDINFEPDLIDNNVRFVIEQYIKQAA